MFLIAFFVSLRIIDATSASCDMNAYCRKVGGPLSYCKTWQPVTACHKADRFTNCATCGAPVTSNTITTSKPVTIGATTKAATSVTTTQPARTAAPSKATTSRTSSNASTTAVTSRVATSATTTKAPTTAASTKTTTRASTTRVKSTTKLPTTTATRTTARTSTATTKAAPLTSNAPTTVRSTSVPTTFTTTKAVVTTGVSQSTISQTTSTVTDTTTTTTVTETTTTVTTTRGSTASPPPVVTITTRDCEALPVYQAPLFLWVEMPNMKARSDFVTFYQRLSTFLGSNCINMMATTLVIRIVHPAYPTAADPLFWPPETSPLFTEMIAKVQLKTANKIKILLYPYVMEDSDRNKWVQFGQSLNVTSLLDNQTSVYDGIFAYTKAWQDYVASAGSSFEIDGFMIDYEEISFRMGTQNLFNFTIDSVGPYRAAYPSIKIGTSVGYDDGKKIRTFDPFIDYFHLQVYDFYYPYASADKSPTDSIFEVFRDNPSGFLSTVLANVLTPSVLKAYAGRESKIKLMWSTQTLANKNCLYPMRNGLCGVNYEFEWTPARFNQFAQMALATPQLGAFEHGLYTYNFMRQDWLIQSSRAP